MTEQMTGPESTMTEAKWTPAGLQNMIGVDNQCLDDGEYNRVCGDDVRQCAAAWEADRATLERVTLDHAVVLSKQADSLLRAELAEAALEQIQDALSVKDHQYLAAWGQLVALRAASEQLANERAERAEAALEQARALAEKWIADGHLHILMCGRALAALLADAPGGAA